MSRPSDNSSLIIDVFPPSAAEWRRLAPPLSFKDGSAPFCIRVWKAFCFAKTAAVISGVMPLFVLESMSRPSDNSSLIMDVFPPFAAEWRRLNPLLSFKDGSAPFCIRVWKAFCLSQYAAIISGVTPSFLLESMSRPSDNSSLIMDVFPPSAALWSRLDPSLFFKDGSAPSCIRVWKAFCLSQVAAIISGVMLSVLLESMSRSSDISSLIMDGFPPCAAMWRRLNPLVSFRDSSAPFCSNIWKASCWP